MSPELEAEWQARPHHQGRAFVSDGIIDESRWRSAPRRVLFLLKEAYDSRPQPIGFDLRQFIRDRRNQGGMTWARVGQWSSLLHRAEPGFTPEFPNAEDSRTAPLSVAVVNIKKSGGSTRSTRDDIFRYAATDAELLRRQIAQIKPDVIIAGGTWEAASVLFPEREKISSRFHRMDIAPCVNFWHPAAQAHNKLLYFALAGILNAAESAKPGVLPAIRPGGSSTQTPPPLPS